MMSVFIGADATGIRGIDNYFTSRKMAFEREWSNDLIVRQMILDIDKSEVIGDGLIKSPVLGYIAPERLSGGVKTLIMMYKCDVELRYELSLCGENCDSWLAWISRNCDVKASCATTFHGFEGMEIDMFIENDGTHITNYKDWNRKVAMLVSEDRRGFDEDGELLPGYKWS